MGASSPAPSCSCSSVWTPGRLERLLFFAVAFTACSLGVASAANLRIRGSLVASELQSSHRGSRVRVRVHDQYPRKEERPLTEAQRALLEEPINVALVTAHYFGDEYARTVDSCSLRGVPLNCSYGPKPNEPIFGDVNELSRAADAVWYHAPHSCFLEAGPWPVREAGVSSPFKARRSQLSVVASMESSAYYRCLENEDFMRQFDVEMTYHLKSEIPLTYWGNGYKETWDKLPPLPIEQKKDAVVYVNSNCDPPSGRNQIVERLRMQPNISVDALGICLNGGVLLKRGAGLKFEAFRKYKYCIAMENSIARDYVTEKVYDALAAGCVPIYFGAPNIEDFVPTLDAIIDYKALGTPEALAAELRRLSANDTAYAEKLRWRGNEASWGRRFRAMVAETKSGAHPQCRLCQVIAKHRLGLWAPKSVGPGRSAAQQPAAQSIVPRFRPHQLKIKYKLLDAPPTSMAEVVNR